jgi:hypothetical protein
MNPSNLLLPLFFVLECNHRRFGQRCPQHTPRTTPKGPSAAHRFTGWPTGTREYELSPPRHPWQMTLLNWSEALWTMGSRSVACCPLRRVQIGFYLDRMHHR